MSERFVSREVYAALLERCLRLEVAYTSLLRQIRVRQPGRRKLDPNAPFKTCTKCRQTKPRKAFQRHPSHRDGLRSRCRECEKPREKARKRDRAAWRAANPDYMKQWRAANKDRIKEHERRRREKRERHTITCPQCGSSFVNASEGRGRPRTYCSDRCRWEAQDARKNGAAQKATP